MKPFGIVYLTMLCITMIQSLPSMRDSLTNPVHVREGDDAVITCVVKEIGKNTVMWKKEDKERHSTRVLTAGDKSVTADKRFMVLHDPVPQGSEEMKEVPVGGDVWVLVIKKSKPTDSGVYVCEVNSNPIVRSFHKLSVTTKALPPPENFTESIDAAKSQLNPRAHNYTDCCNSRNVSQACLGFCNIQSILEGSTGQDPENCETDFPSIVRCMADGRNHVPCCIQERVPDICQDVCRGEYTPITDNIKTHFSCSAYTEQTLACIVEGVELLPSPPAIVDVEALTEKSLKVSWSMPETNAESITEFSVNVTSLRSFDQHLLDPNEANRTEFEYMQTHMVQVNVAGNQNFTILNDLTPFTMYEVTVTSINPHGTSLPTSRVRSLTLTPGNIKPTVGESPKLPDIRACCANKGIGHKTCLNKLCDPAMAAVAEITDLMICAPWAADTFSCLTNGIDHTPCCRARGLPEICQLLCTGNVTSIDFNYFKCLRYMGEYTNCLLQGYGVLPSSPSHVHVTNIDVDFAILHWSSPKTLGDTVVNYNLHYRMLTTYDTDYKTISGVHSPHVLEGLASDTNYEFYVEAVNTHGVGEPSARFNFRTSSKIYEEQVEEASNYNVTGCCVAAELSSVCMPLCSYDAKMSDIKQLARVCAVEFHKLLRCGAGGRNHGACCSRRGVPNECISICNGVIVDNLPITATTCIPYIGNIAQCFEEGTDLLPGPVDDLHAVISGEDSVLVEWEPPGESNNITDYVVYYQKTTNSTPLYNKLLQSNMQVNTTGTSTILTNLDKGANYHIFVVARNPHGTSLPSSIVMLNISKDVDMAQGVTSPPHSLAVSSHSATWVTITWQPPEFSHPSELITYQLYQKPMANTTYLITNTTVTSHMIEKLTPNTQYIVYVRAISKKGPSMPSETLIAWTDPAYPAFVEPPTVHPINLVIEGSSMTILCIAMGRPMPTISLYISGRLVRQEITRHMVTVIHNVTKDMAHISCYADNGYGTPMQASRKIKISYGPHIKPGGITMATLGDSISLECRVDSHPEPKMIFWRNHEERTPVIQGGKYDIAFRRMHDEEDKYVMNLTIHNIEAMDVGDYYCHAENAFGRDTRPVSVRIRGSNTKTSGNIMQCCVHNNVSSACMDACSFFLDIDAVIDKPDCINDFDKLMKCAADGSDHRGCCVHWGVPRRCLDWCRGESLDNNTSKDCLLSHTKHIMSCFHDGRSKLPGPPINVRVEAADTNSVRIAWDLPEKNPQTVEMYRVFWHVVGTDQKTAMKNDTRNMYIVLSDLQDGVTYDCVVKAGNHKGTSVLTRPIRFTMGDKYITSATSGTSGSNIGAAVAIILALIFVAAVFVGTVWLIRTKKMLGVKNQGGVAFENPSYLREVNMDHVQGPALQNDSTSNGVAVAVSATSGGAGWKQESLHVPAQQEVNPTLYEELKLGQDGAGFKRLKP